METSLIANEIFIFLNCMQDGTIQLHMYIKHFSLTMQFSSIEDRIIFYFNIAQKTIADKLFFNHRVKQVAVL